MKRRTFLQFLGLAGTVAPLESLPKTMTERGLDFFKEPAPEVVNIRDHVHGFQPQSLSGYHMSSGCYVVTTSQHVQGEHFETLPYRYRRSPDHADIALFNVTSPPLRRG